MFVVIIIVVVNIVNHYSNNLFQFQVKFSLLDITIHARVWQVVCAFFSDLRIYSPLRDYFIYVHNIF
jgi:hypothetical protein